MTNHEPTTPEQLPLLAAEATPVRFRLDQLTRQRGLAHVAAIKAMLAAKAAERQEHQHQPGRRQAA